MMVLSSTGHRLGAVYAALFFAFGIYLPFYPLLLADRGLSDTEIAIVIAAPMGLRALLSSPLGMFADWIGNRRRVLSLYAMTTALAFSCFPLFHSFPGLLVVSILTALFSNASITVSDAIATSIARQGAGDYGRMRMWGSLSFVVANVFGGALIAGLTAHVLFWGLLAAFWVSAIVLSILPPSVPMELSEVGVPLAAVLSPAHFLRDRVLLVGLVAAALIQASHAMVYSFSSLYWGGTGFSGTIIGVFWATGVVAEVLMFWVSGRRFAGWGAAGMLVLSGFATVIRWILFPVMTSVAGNLLLQSLHALTFACCHLAMMRLIVTRVPDRSAATVQGLYATVGALTMSLATLASGPLYRIFGAHGFQLMAVLPVAAILLVWGVAGFSDRSSEVAP